VNQKKEILFLPSYQWTSYFRYFYVNSEQLYPEGRKSSFTLYPKEACQEKNILYFANHIETPPALSCFKVKKLLKQYPLAVRQTLLTTYYLFEYNR